jgi:periplasmic protein TonB
MAQAAAVLYRVYELPWSTGLEQDQAFRKIARNSAIAILALSMLLSILPAPEIETVVDELPRRLSSFILERETPPPPAPVPVVEEPLPVAEPEPEPEVQQVEEPAPVVQEPVVEPEPVDEVAVARERASVAGLLPFAQELATLRDPALADTLETRELTGSVNAAAPVSERSLITSSVGTSSGGINTAALSRDTGGNGIGSRQTTVVESPVEGFGPAGGAVTRTGESDLGSRSREEIERVFDSNKGAIYALYNRALRADPTLQGKVVLRLTIAPNGTVTFCEIVSSELGDPDLETRLVQRILLFQFEAREVESVTLTKPIDFFPA